MDLSIIIVSFNTKKITSTCLNKLKKNFENYPLSYEIIVVDNGSFDGSKDLLFKLKKNWPQLKVISLTRNLGYAKANNLGLKQAKGKYILFLNSDVFIEDVDFLDLIRLMEYDKLIGAITIKIVLENGLLDKACHRGLPTLWRSFCYLIGLENTLGKVPILDKIFGGYHLISQLKDEIHEVEVISGAFFFTRNNLIKKVGGFDEDYFMYAEDIDLCFKIKRLGYKILYYPLWKARHLKYSSGLENKSNKKFQSKTHHHFYQAMKIFYQKHYAQNYPKFFNQLVFALIDLIKKIRQ